MIFKCNNWVSASWDDLVSDSESTANLSFYVKLKFISKAPIAELSTTSKNINYVFIFLRPQSHIAFFSKSMMKHCN